MHTAILVTVAIGTFIAIIVEPILIATGSGFYRTRGLPIYRREFEVGEGAPALNFTDLTFAMSGEVEFHPLSEGRFAIIERGREGGRRSGRGRCMHAFLEIDDARAQVTVVGMTDWAPVWFLLLFFTAGFRWLESWVLLLGIVAIMAIPYTQQARLYTRLGLAAATRSSGGGSLPEG